MTEGKRSSYPQPVVLPVNNFFLPSLFSALEVETVAVHTKILAFGERVVT
jgi:hypothetical protein